MNPPRLNLRPSTLKSRFTKGFLRALKSLNNKQRSLPHVSSPMEMCRRYLMVKIAADASMASAVGSRRAWSRALLVKIRSRRAQRSTCSKSEARRSISGFSIKNKQLRRKKKKKMKNKCGDDAGIICEAKELRKLVPGGEAMDVWSLLDEAAHYIKCLSTQVNVMTRIADAYSA